MNSTCCSRVMCEKKTFSNVGILYREFTIVIIFILPCNTFSSFTHKNLNFRSFLFFHLEIMWLLGWFASNNTLFRVSTVVLLSESSHATFLKCFVEKRTIHDLMKMYSTIKYVEAKLMDIGIDEWKLVLGHPA